MIHFISNVIIQLFEIIKKYVSFYSLQETTEKILHIFVKIAVFLCLAHVSWSTVRITWAIHIFIMFKLNPKPIDARDR